MAWTFRLTIALGAVLLATAAHACPVDCDAAHAHAGHYGWSEHRAWEAEHRAYEDRARWEEAYAPPCRSACAYPDGELVLSDSFFYGAGGVGPVPAEVFYGGGGYWFVDGGASAFSGACAFASSRAFASASAHANVSVRVHGRMKHGHKRH